MASRILNGENQITQGYKKGKHEAIDIVKKPHMLSDILAHSDGVVIGIRDSYKTTDTTGNSYGNYVKIMHQNGMYTLYAHMAYQSITVKQGDFVTKGQIIGYMGATGRATGSHLHFEVRDINDKKIDSTPYLEQDLPNNNVELDENKTEVKDDLLELVKKTIRGDFGNGEERKKKLNERYEEVQKQVNLNYKNGTTSWSNIRLY